MITVRQASKHHNKLKRSNNDVETTLLSLFFIRVKIINILLLLSFCFYDKYDFGIRRLFIGWKRLKKIFTYYKEQKYSCFTSIFALSVILNCLLGCFFFNSVKINML